MPEVSAYIDYLATAIGFGLSSQVFSLFCMFPLWWVSSWIKQMTASPD